MEVLARLARAAGRVGGRLPAVVDRQPRARAGARRATRASSAGRALHAFARAQPDAARVSPRLLRRDRRFAEAADEHLPAGPRGASARRRLRGAAIDGDLQRRRGRRCGHGGRTDPLGQLRARDGACRGTPLRGARRSQRERGGRRHGRHELRRGARATRAHPGHARDLARARVRGAHHGFPRGRRAQRRRRRRLDRVDRLGWAAARRTAERSGRPGPCLLRAWRQRADRDRRGSGARLHRPRLLPRRHDGARRKRLPSARSRSVSARRSVSIQARRPLRSWRSRPSA